MELGIGGGHCLLSIAYCLLPTSDFVLPTSCFRLRASHTFCISDSSDFGFSASDFGIFKPVDIFSYIKVNCIRSFANFGTKGLL